MSTFKCSQGSFMIPCGLFFAYFTYFRRSLQLPMYLESNNGRSHVAGLHESTRVTTSSQADKPRLLNLDLIYELGCMGLYTSKEKFPHQYTSFYPIGNDRTPFLPPSLPSFVKVGSSCQLHILLATKQMNLLLDFLPKFRFASVPD